jgi:methionine sulfoxide reductase heme-binding subunit
MLLLLVTGLSVLGGMVLLEGQARERVSLSLAYLSLAGFSGALSLGSLNLVRRRPNPSSFDLRRDIGIWTALLALTHTVVGLTVHLQGRMSLYFLAPADQRLPGTLRLDAFGVANHAGLLALLLLVGLALISSDAWLSRLGVPVWKRWQRLAYLAAGLTVCHGTIYIILERRERTLVLGFLGLIVLALLAQGAGLMITRRQRRHTA